MGFGGYVSTRQFEIRQKMIDWALDRAGLSMGAAKKRAPILEKIEWGDVVELSYTQLDSLARITRTPLGYFFLPEPPVEELPIPDFRTRRDQQVREMSPDLIETVFDMHARQQWYREYALGEGYEPVPFVGSANVGEPIVEVARTIRASFGLSEGWASRIYNLGETVSYIRDLFQENGILVVINGVVGNNPNRKLDVEEFRGFVLSDKMAPLVFVNNADFKAAQVFTLFHELVHLWIDRDGIIDLDENANSEGEVETFCNRVAAEILVPENELASYWVMNPVLHMEARTLARRFKVSPIVIGRRLLDSGLVSRERYLAFYNEYVAGGFRDNGVDSGSGGNFYNNQNNRIGKRFMRAVARALMEGKVSYTHAFKLTGLKGATFDKYVKMVGGAA